MSDYLKISGYLFLPDLTGRTYTKDTLSNLKNYADPYTLVVEDLVYRLEIDAFESDYIDIDHNLEEMGIDPDDFDYEGFNDFLLDFLERLGDEVDIQEITFGDFEDGGYNYDATLNYKVKDLVEKFQIE